MIPKDILKKIKPWMWLSTYIVLLLFALVHFQDLMGVLGKVMHLLTPLFYAIGIAFVLNQPMKAIEKGLIKLIQALPRSKKNPPQREPKVRGISIFLTLLLALAVLFVLSSIIFPQLITSIVQLFNNCVVYAGNIVENINNLLASLHLENIEWDLDTAKLQAALDQLGLSADKIFQTATNWVGGTGMTVINNISAITVGLSNWVMGFMLSLYLLSSKEKFIRQLKKLIGALLPLSAANRMGTKNEPDILQFHFRAAVRSVYSGDVVLCFHDFVQDAVCHVNQHGHRCYQYCPDVRSDVGNGVRLCSDLRDQPVDVLVFHGLFPDRAAV